MKYFKNVLVTLLSKAPLPVKYCVQPGGGEFLSTPHWNWNGNTENCNYTTLALGNPFTVSSVCQM